MDVKKEHMKAENEIIEKTKYRWNEKTKYMAKGGDEIHEHENICQGWSS